MNSRDDLTKVVEDFCKCLDSREYFEAHEILEEAWHPLRRAKDPIARPIKGLINAAIAFEHLKRNRPKSYRVAKITIDSYDRKITQESCLKKAIARVEYIRKQWNI